jgi:hypothetical protein
LQRPAVWMALADDRIQKAEHDIGERLCHGAI